jgi:uncharacterized protein YjlB
MPILEDAKHAVENATGFGRPRRSELASLARKRKPHLFRFRDDGETPNNPNFPLIVYRSPVLLRDGFDAAAIFEDLFAANGWKDAWRDGVYDFLHFHTRTHEVLGIARGMAQVEFGGAKGRIVSLKASDVIVLPAGTGHRRIAASRDLLVVGAYPTPGKYDEPKPQDRDHAKAVRSIARVGVPRRDPVYGAEGPLLAVWKTRG